MGEGVGDDVGTGVGAGLKIGQASLEVKVNP